MRFEVQPKNAALLGMWPADKVLADEVPGGGASIGQAAGVAVGVATLVRVGLAPVVGEGPGVLVGPGVDVADGGWNVTFQLSVLEPCTSPPGVFVRLPESCVALVSPGRFDNVGDHENGVVVSVFWSQPLFHCPCSRSVPLFCHSGGTGLPAEIVHEPLLAADGAKLTLNVATSGCEAVPPACLVLVCVPVQPSCDEKIV